MKLLYLLCLIPLCFTAKPKSGIYFPIENGLTVVTDQTYEELEQTYDLIFIAHGAHWNDMAMRFLLKIEDAVEELQQEFPYILFSKVNGHNNEEVIKHFKISGFPSYFLIYKGRPVERYHGNLNAESMRKWLKEQLLPLGIKVSTRKEIEDKKKDNDAVFVYFGDDQEDLSTIAFVLFNHRDIPLLIANEDSGLMTEYKISTLRTLKLYKKYDEKEHEIVIKPDVKLEEEEIEEFIKTYSLPLIMQYDKKSYTHIFRNKNPGLFLIQSSQETINTKDLLPLVKEYRSKLNVIEINTTDTELRKEFLNNYNITEADLPSVKYFDLKYTSKPNDVSKPFNYNNIKKEIERLIVSTPNRANEKEPSSVFTLEKKTFQKEVIDNDLDVLVKFYAPWCGHCKRLAPIYEGLAAKFSPNPMIRIAEIDATVHNIDSVKVTGYPTLMLFAKGKKNSPIVYKGNRQFEDLENFIKNNAGNLAPKQDL